MQQLNQDHDLDQDVVEILTTNTKYLLSARVMYMMQEEKEEEKEEKG